MFVQRELGKVIKKFISKRKSILLLGPRQTGKTSLVENSIQTDLEISFLQTHNKLKYEKNPELLIQEIRPLKDKLGKIPLIYLDEIQKVPSLLDEIQFAIDKKLAIFILTGSSARKLRRQQKEINLLPGRLISLRLDPFTHEEYPNRSLRDLLYYGSLPEISLENDDDYIETLLESYVQTYLEEEIRMEALVREVGTFNRFLEFAGIESSKLLSFSSISQELGVAHTTVQNYFQVLVDTLVAERIDPVVKSSTRKRLVKSSRYLIFDMGVRRQCANEGTNLSKEKEGELFEHFIGLELIKLARLKSKKIKIKFWKDLNGPEVDWIIDSPSGQIPIEVKLTSTPKKRDIRHLELFLDEYQDTQKGFVVCQTEKDLTLSDRITAISWKKLSQLIP
ncbi:MAG: ATP-binding protein [Bacteriovoracaceae bacterium]|nr:ATP-binding protein [Bacteriovoracaceae bacterium]